MEKKKSVTLVIQIVIFTVFLFFFTLGGGDRARFTIGGLFLLVGIILLSFKKPIAEGMYKRQINAIKERSSVKKLTEGVNHGGMLTLSVGMILVLISFIV